MLRSNIEAITSFFVYYRRRKSTSLETVFKCGKIKINTKGGIVMKWGYLLLEILPLICWVFAHNCEKNSRAFPNVEKGFKKNRMKKSAQAWMIGNQMVGKSLKFSSTMLIMLNLLFFFASVTNVEFVILLNVLVILTSFLSVNKKINTVINESGVVNVIKKEKIWGK